MRRVCHLATFAGAPAALRCASACHVKARTVRNPKFNTVTDADKAFFESVLGKYCVSSGEQLQAANTDWFKDYEGNGPVCLFPKSTEQVSAIVRHCSDRNLAVVPQGGNTGFVGGAVPVFDEVIINLRRMNKVLDVDGVSATLQCEAGCVLETLDDTLRRDYGLMMPVDLGAKGSCHIGGNISTNAGGLRYMRYGSLHANVLGLRVVLPSGEVLDEMNVLRKDNTGYHLKHLFVGAEGTLGIVTEVALSLPPAPRSTQTIFCACPDWQSLCDLFTAARERLGEVLSAAEMIDGQALDLCLKLTGDVSPLAADGGSGPYYMLIELNGSNADHDNDKLSAFLEHCLEKNIVSAGTIAQSEMQVRHIWKMREACALAPTAAGHVRWYDISMPSREMAAMIDGARDCLVKGGFADRAKIIGFGHFGDGNLHVNVVTIPSFDQRVVDCVDEFMYSYSRARRYSVSAEHGIGLQKRGYLNYTKPDANIAHMRRIKTLFDPQGIMNPYKVFEPVQ